MKLGEVIVELWLARRLGLPLSWAAGVTTRDQRRETIRAAILAKGLANDVAGKRPNKTPETWAQVFQRVYARPLNESPTESTGT
jgi:hypothetical protein